MSSSPPPPAPGPPPPPPPTHPNPNPSASNLARILADHLAWVQSAGSQGQQADLTGQDLSGLNLAGVILSGAKLERVNLSGANLAAADFRGAYLADATFEGAQIQEADFRYLVSKPCDLTRVNFRNANLTRARLGEAALFQTDFRGASLEYADFRNAKFSSYTPKTLLAGIDLTRADCTSADLFGMDLTGTTLTQTDLSYADLREVQNCRFDTTCVRGARLSPYCTDRWSVLRRQYSGPRMLLNLLLLVAYLIPLAAQILFWVAVGRAQAAAVPLAREWAAEGRRLVQAGRSSLDRLLNQTKEKVRDQVAAADARLAELDTQLEAFAQSRPTPPGADSLRAQLHRTTDALNAVADRADEETRLLTLRLNSWATRVESFTAQWRETSVGSKVVRYDEGIVYAVVAVLMSVYNLIRGFLTWRVSPLRDEEERSGYTPGAADCDRLYWFDRWLLRWLSYLAWVSIALFLWQISQWLTTPVWFPAGPPAG